MKFGWLTLGHSPSPEEDCLAIDQQLEQACLAEELGFDTVWLTEHNFTGESVYGDPIPFAAALAMKTERIRIGFAVIQMALRHPVRIATQLAVIDNLCKGRLDVGVGRGSIYNEYEFAGYGLDSTDSRERLAEGLEILEGVWTTSPFTYKGKYYDLTLPELRPRPYQQPHPPIRHSVVSPPSFTACGARGVPIMTVRLSPEQLRERLGLYEQGLAQSGLDEASCQAMKADAGVWRYIHVAPSQAQAEDELSEALLHIRHHMTHARQTLNPDWFQVDDTFLNPWTDAKVPDEEALKFALGSGAFVGTPETVSGQIEALRDLGVGHLLCQMSYGFMSHDRVMNSMRLFGDNVLPRFRAAASRPQHAMLGS
jgi:alkanesulfonate monooxygenase SsuD/methylene tetrahydromethanopterin reductase-like flavin-dependent oxidoreductase (luciferase family)